MEEALSLGDLGKPTTARWAHSSRIVQLAGEGEGDKGSCAPVLCQGLLSTSASSGQAGTGESVVCLRGTPRCCVWSCHQQACSLSPSVRARGWLWVTELCASWAAEEPVVPPPAADGS